MHHNTHASHSGTFLFDEDRSPFRLGFGALRITGPQGFGPPANEKNSLEVLKECLRLGVNFIDTADSYGPNISEELIARALYPYPKELLIATKGGYERPSPGEWQLNCWRDALENALKGSLKRLKVDRIDLYQLHRFDPAVPADEFLDKLKELQEQEYILHLGLSEVSIAQIEQAQQYFEVKSIQTNTALRSVNGKKNYIGQTREVLLLSHGILWMLVHWIVLCCIAWCRNMNALYFNWRLPGCYKSHPI